MNKKKKKSLKEKLTKKVAMADEAILAGAELERRTDDGREIYVVDRRDRD